MPKILALVAPTASGKSELALRLARALDAEIFSIDSLSIYREIAIASAKPSPQELQAVRHYGIDVLRPDEHCSAEVFCNLFRQALRECKKDFLLIVGGSGFYLSCLCEGLSQLPTRTEAEQDTIAKHLATLANPYALLARIDPLSASRIKPKDTYRIHKLLELYFATSTPPSAYFATHSRISLLAPPPIYTIATPKEELWARIHSRTNAMLAAGLLTEARTLLARYGAGIQPFSSIGLKECLDHLRARGEIGEEGDKGEGGEEMGGGAKGRKMGAMDRGEQRDICLPLESKQDPRESKLAELITIHTRQLAKRQATYIRSKFPDARADSRENLYELILRECASTTARKPPVPRAT